MKQKIWRSTISFKCDGGSESLEQILCVLLIVAENFQINVCKHVTNNLAQIYFADGNFASMLSVSLFEQMGDNK
jgi:hypothetical protein